jgi:hypothetical protein
LDAIGSDDPYTALKAFHKNGWRMHHSYKEGDVETYYLTTLICRESDGVLFSDLISVSQESLLHKSNYLYLFPKSHFRKALANSYNTEYGFKITDPVLIEAFDKEEEKLAKDDEDGKKIFDTLRSVFDIPQKKKEDPATDSKPKIKENEDKLDRTTEDKDQKHDDGDKKEEAAPKN